MFGTLDASQVTSKLFIQYTSTMSGAYTLPYTIQSGDRIGVMYTGGNATNLLAVLTDQNNTFDGGGSYLNYYTTKWTKSTNADLTMRLSLIETTSLIGSQN